MTTFFEQFEREKNPNNIEEVRKYVVQRQKSFDVRKNEAQNKSQNKLRLSVSKGAEENFTHKQS